MITLPCSYLLNIHAIISLLPPHLWWYDVKYVFLVLRNWMTIIYQTTLLFDYLYTWFPLYLENLEFCNIQVKNKHEICSKSKQSLVFLTKTLAHSGNLNNILLANYFWETIVNSMCIPAFQN